ncbi:MAG: hypothetical protein U0835_02730 [Isosphaeraceae bacterium]
MGSRRRSSPSPPAIQGLGVSGGFQLQVEDQEVGLQLLQRLTDEMITDGNTQSGLRAGSSSAPACPSYTPTSTAPR